MSSLFPTKHVLNRQRSVSPRGKGKGEHKLTEGCLSSSSSQENLPYETSHMPRKMCSTVHRRVLNTSSTDAMMSSHLCHPANRKLHVGPVSMRVALGPLDSDWRVHADRVDTRSME
ncbi:hypothetical protein OIU78_001836 [Salix suchowensis]|nr:hypothetical protein OIU78_001836 [Salix suchowensis]